MEILYENLLDLTLPMVIMWAIGGVLIYLAIAKDMEPTLLLPIGFGCILANLPPIIGQVMENGVLARVEEYAMDAYGWTYCAVETLYLEDDTTVVIRYDENGEVIE